jgi:serine protease Do
VQVVLADGKKEFTATIVGTDPQTDLAVLKVDAEDLPAITFGDSDQLEVGDVVLAIGNPFGVGQTVTSGIVSGVSRGGFGIVDYENFIQTDADINPGNSGGALVDAQGRLIGINTAIISRTGGSMGIGFAVPATLARTILERILADGKVRRGYLGVAIQPLTPELAKEFGVADGRGALVGEVQDNTPAARAGLEAGDVIVELDGRPVEDSRQFRLWVAQTPPGTKVQLKVQRDGRPKTLSVTLGELPQELARAGGGGQGSPADRDALDGVEVGDLDNRLRRQFNIPTSVEGALVLNVDPDSNAYEAGLRQGDVIVGIDRQPVASADDAVQLSDAAKGDKILLRIWSRKGGFGGGSYILVDNTKRK